MMATTEIRKYLSDKGAMRKASVEAQTMSQNAQIRAQITIQALDRRIGKSEVKQEKK